MQFYFITNSCKYLISCLYKWDYFRFFFISCINFREYFGLFFQNLALTRGGLHVARAGQHIHYVGKLPHVYMSRVLGRKRGLMHVRKMSSQISLRSPHRLIRDDTFRFYGIFSFKEVTPHRKSRLGEKCRPWLAVRTAQANQWRHFKHMH